LIPNAPLVSCMNWYNQQRLQIRNNIPGRISLRGNTKDAVSEIEGNFSQISDPLLFITVENSSTFVNVIDKKLTNRSFDIDHYKSLDQENKKSINYINHLNSPEKKIRRSEKAEDYRLYTLKERQVHYNIQHSSAEPTQLQQKNCVKMASQPSWTNPHAQSSSGPGNPVGGFPNNPSNAPPAGGAVVPESYFTESRKGEVNELRQLLRNFSMEKNALRKREIIKKVIAYMTLGIDVSRLFTEMMLVIETRDLVIKKMVYLFLCNYATANPELAQMCTNTLTKDCANDDPMVRGLALRSLCSLRLPQMVEYVSEPVRRSLNDSHAYVRKTAVMGILKIYHLNSNVLEECGFVDTLYDMLKDPDSSVVTNCIIVLNELMEKGPDSGMAINRAIMLHLLNRLQEFSEFGVLAILDLVPRYIPANEEEGFQIMNLLDPVLRTTNAGAFMAVIFAFLSLAKNVNVGDSEGMTLQIVSRVKAPVITMMTGGSSELMYCLLKHVDALIDLCPGIFDDEYRQFYIRYHEPTNVKYLKISILAKLVNPDNAPDIVAELSECVGDIDSELGRSSVRAMGRIACRNVGGEGCADSIARRLVDMLDLDISHVSSEAATALACMLRKHPSLKEVISPPLPRALKYMTESSGKASLVYLLGECGDIINEAPYSIEKLIDDYDDIKDTDVKIALLMSTMKLFFKRAPEVQLMLGKLLRKSTEDVSSQDLHDRALLYYRLLRAVVDPSTVQDLVLTDSYLAGTTNFSEEELDDDIRDELMKEFNTLSILYGSTSESFIEEEFQVKFVRMPREHPLDSNLPPVESLEVNDVIEQINEGSIEKNEIVPTLVAEPVAEIDLLGFGNQSTTSIEEFVLNPAFSLSSDEYQSKWGSVDDAQAHVMSVSLKMQPSATNSIEEPLGQTSILTMASGDLPTEMKFFLYAQESSSDGTIYLAQASISKSVSPVDLLLTVKLCGSGDRDKAQKFVDLVKSALSMFV